MVNILNYIPHLLFLSILILTVSLALYDYRKKRKFKEYPFASFIIPTYNDAETIERTIKSIYNCYEKDKLEIIVINDCSKDNTCEILNRIKKSSCITIINNKINIGKSKSVNNAFHLSEGEIIFILDSDVTLNEKSIKNLISNFDSNPKVGAVSCRYKIINKGFLPRMTDLEFSMLALSNAAYNVSSSLSLWGGCMAFRRKAFEDIGLLKENMITEDFDASLNLRYYGWKAEQSWYPIETTAPTKIKKWLEQKIRWASGGMQCFMKHPKAFLFNPISIIYTLLYSILSFYSIYFMINNTWNILDFFIAGIFYSILTIPYAVLNIKKLKEIYKIIYVIPFSFFYYPIFTLISIIGFGKGVYKYFELKDGKRAW